ncbi:MAG: hypothetical protein AAFU64_12810, partial [Bacteroidota bacterium]
MKRYYQQFLIYLVMSIMAGLYACKSLPEATGLRSKSKVHPELQDAYQKWSENKKQNSPSTDSKGLNEEEFIRIEAFAQEDVEKLKKELEKYGLKGAIINGQIINGQFPISQIPQLEKLKSLRSVLPVRRPKLRQNRSGFLKPDRQNLFFLPRSFGLNNRSLFHFGSTYYWRFLPGLLANSGSSLRAGDIVILGFSSDQKRIVFLNLVDLEEGCQIIFTDNAWLGSRFRTSEGAFSYTVPAGGIPAGTVMDVSGTTDSEWAANGPEFDAPVSGLGTNGLNLSTGGDQILIFTGTSEAPGFIFALNGASNQFSDPANADDANRTTLPSNLTQGGNALAFGAGDGDEDEFDNIWYNGPTSGSREELLQAITDTNNWQGDDESFAPITSNFTLSPNLAQVPSAHPSAFQAQNLNAAQIQLSWEDPRSGTLPTDYLILVKTPELIFPGLSNGNLVEDDLDLNDGMGAINVPFGQQKLILENLESLRTYDFIIY